MFPSVSYKISHFCDKRNIPRKLKRCMIVYVFQTRLFSFPIVEGIGQSLMSLTSCKTREIRTPMIWMPCTTISGASSRWKRIDTEEFLNEAIVHVVANMNVNKLIRACSRFCSHRDAVSEAEAGFIEKHLLFVFLNWKCIHIF